MSRPTVYAGSADATVGPHVGQDEGVDVARGVNVYCLTVRWSREAARDPTGRDRVGLVGTNPATTANDRHEFCRSYRVQGASL